MYNVGIVNPSKNEFQPFLPNNLVHILHANEPHLTTYSFCIIPGYITYQCDHFDGTAYAGSAIFIKSNIQHLIWSSYQSISTSVQHTNIVLILNHIPTTISSV